MRVRPAEERDADAILALASEFATSFIVEERAFRTSFSELISSPSAHLAIAEADGTVAGYILGFDHPAFFANGRVTWVEEIMVSAAHRRLGTGRALMEELEKWSRGRGSRLVALATRRAASFYTAIGYEESALYFRKLL